jgi:hypothetical protein
MDVAHFRQKAAQCRRLAAALAPNDETRERLLKLAAEYEATAESLASTPPPGTSTA